MAEFDGITEWRGEEVFILATKANIRAMKKAAFLVEGDIKVSLSKPGTGATQIRYSGKTARGRVTRRVVRVSRPGEPPALDTGILMNSIASQVDVGALTVTGKVGVDDSKMPGRIPYGLHLELGTKYMRPRPYLRPALKRNKRKIDKIFSEANR